MLLFSRSVVSDSLRPHGLQHARLPCPSPSPRACSNSRPLSRWCHPTITLQVGERRGGRGREGGRKRSKKKWRKRGREGKIQAEKNMCACVLSHIWLFETLWTTAHQAPLSMGFFRQEYWSRLPFSPPGQILTQGSNPQLLHCRQILHHWAIREAWQKKKATHNLQSPSTVLQSRHFDKRFFNRTKLLKYPLISSFLPQPQAWVKSERKHSFRFQPTNHPWDLGEGLALRVGSHRSKQHLEC